MMKKWRRIFVCILYYGLAQYLPSSSMPLGGLSRKIRARLCSKLFFSCGKNVNIESKAFFHSGRQISIGDYSGIGMAARLSGEITIGNNVMMGQQVIILTQNHEFSGSDTVMRLQGMQPERPVRIGNDVWIGARVIILPGVEIGDGAVLGAGAVIAGNVPSCAIVAGNPARVIRFRDSSLPKHT